MTIPILTDNNIRQELLQGRAGRGRQGYKPGLIVLHIQDGDGDIHNYFAGAYADSTMWNPINGAVTRYLFDEDTAWTDGDWSNPDLSDPVIARYYNQLNPFGLNSNVVALTVENEGFPGGTMPPAQYNRLVGLITYWCKKWNIPPTRDYIIGHYQCGEHKYCPGPIIENRWAQIIADVQACLLEVTPVAPGKIVGAGMRTEAKRRGDTLFTVECYAERINDKSMISFAWGLKCWYFWDSVGRKTTAYLKVAGPAAGHSTIEAEALYRGEPLLTVVQSATRKSDGSLIKLAWSQNFVYFYDALTKQVTSYRKA